MFGLSCAHCFEVLFPRVGKDTPLTPVGAINARMNACRCMFFFGSGFFGKRAFESEVHKTEGGGRHVSALCPGVTAAGNCYGTYLAFLDKAVKLHD